MHNKTNKTCNRTRLIYGDRSDTNNVFFCQRTKVFSDMLFSKIKKKNTKQNKSTVHELIKCHFYFFINVLIHYF